MEMICIILLFLLLACALWLGHRYKRLSAVVNSFLDKLCRFDFRVTEVEKREFRGILRSKSLGEVEKLALSMDEMIMKKRAAIGAAFYKAFWIKENILQLKERVIAISKILADSLFLEREHTLRENFESAKTKLELSNANSDKQMEETIQHVLLFLDEQMDNINQGTILLANAMKDLESTINLIFPKSQFIKKLTTRVDLLALNSSIEAARAGNAGRGFGVVAFEIKKLAEDTQKSAEDIESALKELLDSLQKTKKVFQRFEDSVQNSTERVEKAALNIEKYVKNSQNALDNIKKKVEGLVEELITHLDGILEFIESIIDSFKKFAQTVNLFSVNSLVEPEEAFSEIKDGKAILVCTMPQWLIPDEVACCSFYLNPEKFEKVVEKLPKDKKYFLLCLSGHIASWLFELLKEHSFRNVFVVKGGLIGWKKAKLPLQPKSKLIEVEKYFRG